MARLIIKKYKNTNDKSAAFGKTYGRLVHQDTMNTTDLCRHMMKHGTIYTSDIVKGVVEKFINCFEELLLEGNRREGFHCEQREGHPRAIPARPEQGERVHGQDAHLKGSLPLGDRGSYAGGRGGRRRQRRISRSPHAL